ncbi:MAG: lactoferrin/transferrin family TonB-dependent receptor [Acinetobacter sp.]|nr:lactoferrin/transferrin family TonB-dependent receptor [Acinetobacter sp.]
MAKKAQHTLATGATGQKSYQAKYLSYAVHLAILSQICIAGTAWADDKKEPTKPTQQLETIVVVAKEQSVTRYDQEVTGLGKVVKTADDLAKQQVLGIRDLTRYDPGISVVEQGRGASSGYAIRGVDKNRVAVVVDGIAQGQSYVDESNRRGNGTGAMNEVEFENLTAVTINKGSNSSEVGSGALGGSVSFTTKNVDDVIKDGKDWGVQSKSMYSSKDERFAQTVAVAGKSDGFEAMVQYTRREGEGTKAHKDAGNVSQRTTRKTAYISQYDLRDGSLSDNLFRMSECTTGDDCWKHKARLSQAGGESLGTRTQDELSAAELAQYKASKDIVKYVNAESYTGPNRLLANPLDYQSDSWLARVGYRPNDHHYIGAIFEQTEQRYDSRDMTYCEYASADCPEQDYSPVNSNSLIYRNYLSNIWSGTATNLQDISPFLAYARGKWLNEFHQKQRVGLNYHYTPSDVKWLDSIKINLDQQDIHKTTQTVMSACSVGSLDRNCQLDASKVGQYRIDENMNYQEQHQRVDFQFDKNASWFGGEHAVNVGAGLDLFESKFNAKARRQVVTMAMPTDVSWIDSPTGVGKVRNPLAYSPYTKNGRTLIGEVYQDYGTAVFSDSDNCGVVRDCDRLPITGHNWYVSLRDNMKLNRYFDVGLSARYDQHRIESDDENIVNKTYRNTSWNAGIVFKPTDHWSLSARLSQGFRVPSFQEIYGYDALANTAPELFASKPTDLDSEKSRTGEIGLRYQNDVADIEVSVFDSRYRDMIAYATPTQIAGEPRQRRRPYNVQNLDLHGLNVNLNVDLHGLVEIIPAGIKAHVAYGHTKVKRNGFKNLEQWDSIESYALSAIQPPRYVYGLSYDDSEGKWGIQANWTYSRAKDVNELLKSDYCRLCNVETPEVVASINPRSWITLDLLGHLQVNDDVTVRAGIYNALNYRYTTWENARQTENYDNRKPTTMAAAGRNFTLGVELKF